MYIYIGSDHAGFQMKNELKEYLEKKYSVDYDSSLVDLGVFTSDSADYPVIAREVCEKVRENHNDVSFGILICGSGVGVNIVANRMKGIRAVLANNLELAELSRSHNNANVLCLGARLTSIEDAKAIADKFITTKFSGEERHQKRVDIIDKMFV